MVASAEEERADGVIAGSHRARPVRAGARPTPRFQWWEATVLVVAVAASAVAIVMTARADFLGYPGWLAVQKADVILGPVCVGLYWRRRRPASVFGPALITLGLLHIPYILQSSSNSTLFTIGIYWGQSVIYVATLAIILAFPTGRLTRVPDGAIMASAVLLAALPACLLTLFTSHVFAGGSISGCRGPCPPLAVGATVDSSVVTRLVDVGRAGIIAVAVAIALRLLWRLAVGTRPQRRALAIGTPIALLFLVTQSLYQVTMWLGYGGHDLDTYVRWLFVIARSALWYGFLLALLAAQLFAADVLRRIVRESLRRPSLPELEDLLREPLGDPELQLAFRDHDAHAWFDGNGNVVEPPAERSGRALTELEYEGRPGVAVVHDIQLKDDPELVEAAGATALLAFENAQLHTAWAASLEALRASRARLAAASDRERRTLERDLHDGAQQSLVALGVRFALLQDRIEDAQLRHDLGRLGGDLERAIGELRDLAHGIYPSELVDLGLVSSLRSVAQNTGRPVTVSGDRVGRHPAETESAVYYCCREALQNALRHAGPDARVEINLWEADGELRFEVRDDGPGFDITMRGDGSGLRNIEDRIRALEGRVAVSSTPGAGVTVAGAVPLRS